MIFPSWPATGSQSWFPWIAVDDLTGLVNVVYYCMDVSPTNFTTNSYVAYSTDTVKVTSEVDSTKVPGQEYQHVFSLKRAFYVQGGYSVVQFMLVAPHIGVVNQSIDIFDGGPAQNQSFELISYTVQ